MKLKLSGMNISKYVAVIAGGILLAASGVFLSGCMPSDEQVDAANDLINEAQELFVAQQYAEALQKYEEARLQDDGNVDVYTGIAAIYLLKNRIDDAKDVLEVGVERSREPGEGYVYLGRIALDENNAELAVSYMRTASNSNKEDYEARYLLAEAYVENGDFGKAEKTLDIPEEAGDWYVRSKYLQAVLLRDDVDEARKEIEAALSVEIVDDDLEDMVDSYYELLDDVEELIDEDATPEHVAVTLSYGALLGGYEDVVIDSLEDYASDNEEYWDLHLYLGRAYYMNGEIGKAKEQLTEAVALNPVDPYGPWYLARILVEEGSDTDAQDMYSRAIGLAEAEEKDEIRLEYVDVLMDMGQYASAEDQIRVLEDAAEEDDVRNGYTLMRVESLLERELFSQATEILEGMDDEALSDELQAEYLWMLGVIAFNSGDRSLARSDIERALELNDFNPKYYLLLGQIQFEDGDSEGAQVSLERAVDLDLDGKVSVEAVKVLDRI